MLDAALGVVSDAPHMLTVSPSCSLANHDVLLDGSGDDLAIGGELPERVVADDGVLRSVGDNEKPAARQASGNEWRLGEVLVLACAPQTNGSKNRVPGLADDCERRL